MTKPGRVQLSRKKGWRKPDDTILVARPGRWGNPFPVGGIGPDGQVIADRSASVALFRQMVDDPAWRKEIGYPADLSSLRGKNLACWCPLGGPCHADILLELANSVR